MIPRLFLLLEGIHCAFCKHSFFQTTPCIVEKSALEDKSLKLLSIATRVLTNSPKSNRRRFGGFGGEEFQFWRRLFQGISVHNKQSSCALMLSWIIRMSDNRFVGYIFQHWSFGTLALHVKYGLGSRKVRQYVKCKCSNFRKRSLFPRIFSKLTFDRPANDR